MEVLTPKTPQKQTTRDIRLKIQTLYYTAEWTISNICLQLNLTQRQVQYALESRPTPQRHACGRKAILDIPRRKQLIEWVTSSRESRYTPWIEIPSILGWNCGEKAIRTAMKKEGYTRAVSRKKPPLSEQNRQIRLQWALEHVNWTQEQWDKILWSDETWVMPGAHKRQWVTRKIGPSELYHQDCVVEKHQRKIGWMFWGTISGKYGKGTGLFWEKDWGKINKYSYCEKTIPQVKEYMDTHPGLIFQQDGAPGHRADETINRLQELGITRVIWPAFSPDMSPIETIWDYMKDWLQDRYPNVHKNYRRLREAVIKAWEAVPQDWILQLVSQESMRKRCQAVIDAQGGETKY